MSDIELKFCDLCGVSIPQRDLDEGTAREVSGRVIGACCLSKILATVPQAQRPKPKSPEAAQGASSASSGVPVLYAAIVMVLAIFFITWFIDSRASQRHRDLDRTIGGTEKRLAEVEGQIRLQADKIAGLSSSEVETEVAALSKRFDAVDEKLAAIGGKDNTTEFASLRDALTEIEGKLGKLGGDQTSLETALDTRLRQVTDAIGELHRGLDDLSRARMAAAEPGESTAKPATDKAKAEPGALPEALAKRVKQLASTDASVRWAAVDELLRSNDKNVVPHLLPMLNDPDAFVRRLCATGLGNLGDDSACPALVKSLEDEQPIVRQAAYRSLVKLSGQNFPFDAQASKSKRRVQVKKWQEWLKKAD